MRGGIGEAVSVAAGLNLMTVIDPCGRSIRGNVRVAQQADGRWRFWGIVPEFGGRYLRVVTLEDGITIHNAFPDRRFIP